ncbi:hypothetical protein WMW72_08710 [Paenibacillus filicis]|uniref:Fibronectin type-III domain-containing protein n=1 Tax=Paenibacillus filicis TaxID=669464 RepID=A0ABU9DGV7_9BACL
MKKLLIPTLAATLLLSIGSGSAFAQEPGVPAAASSSTSAEAFDVSALAATVRLNINWPAVSGATDYRITIRDSVTDNVKVNQNTNGSRSFSFDGSAGTTYKVWVGAYNSQGTLIKNSIIQYVYLSENENPNTIAIQW